MVWQKRFSGILDRSRRERRHISGILLRGMKQADTLGTLKATQNVMGIKGIEGAKGG